MCISDSVKDEDDNNMMDFMRSCPSPNKLFPENVRRPLRDLVSGICPRISNTNRLRATDFQASNSDHLRKVFDMGITMVSLGNGKVQLLHSFYNVSIINLATCCNILMINIILRQNQQKKQNEDYYLCKK